jgi:hypothetical protein
VRCGLAKPDPSWRAPLKSGFGRICVSAPAAAKASDNGCLCHGLETSKGPAFPWHSSSPPTTMMSKSLIHFARRAAASA